VRRKSGKEEEKEGMHKVRSEIILNDSESAAVSQGGNKPTTNKT
jgi:hypothetical protein